MRAAKPTMRTTESPFQGFARARRIADAVKVKVGRRTLAVLTGLASVVAVVLLVQRTGTSVFQAAATPNWRYLLVGLLICAAVQPLRALAWTSTVREPDIGFRAMYTASSVGSFLDTVLPGRLGEASKVAVLKITAGPRWPGFSRAGGSLLCAHLLEMIAFVLVGAGSAFFLPVPGWAKITMVVGLPTAAAGLALVSVLHAKLSHRLPEGVGAFLAGAAAPKKIMLRAGAILVVTWVARWFGVLFLLHAVGVHVGVGWASRTRCRSCPGTWASTRAPRSAHSRWRATTAPPRSRPAYSHLPPAASPPERPRSSASRSTAAASGSSAAQRFGSNRVSTDPLAGRRARRNRPSRRRRA